MFQYLNNPLSALLLRRSLLNRKIGHFFFWHLRSELHLPSVLVRFGTLLEAFCRGLGPYLKKLIKQTEALDKLTKLTDSLKDRFEAAPGKERMKFMSDREIVFRSLTFAEPAMVFIFDEFLDDDELGVRNVPDGLSELS